jgi:hypothetical protein
MMVQFGWKQCGFLKSFPTEFQAPSLVANIAIPFFKEEAQAEVTTNKEGLAYDTKSNKTIDTMIQYSLKTLVKVYNL